MAFSTVPDQPLPDDGRQLRAQFLDLAFRKNTASTLVNLIVGSVFCLLAKDFSPRIDWLSTWFAALVIVSLARLGSNGLYFRIAGKARLASAPTYWLWYGIYVGGLMSAASLWITLSILHLPNTDFQTSFVLLMLITALAAGASGTLASARLPGQIYIALMLLPATLIVTFNERYPDGIGELGVLFIAVMIYTHYSNHTVLRESLQLRNANSRLVDRLSREKKAVETLNASLEQRVEERTAELEDIAHTDPLTGFFNRLGIARWFRHQESKATAIVFVDVTSLQQINNTLGHDFGDAVLQVIATRLEERLSRRYGLCRWGGNEFVILVPESDSPQEVAGPEAALEVMTDILAAGCLVRGRLLHLNYRIGYAHMPSDAVYLGEGIRAASLACAEASRDGDGAMRPYIDEMRLAQERRLNVTQALKHACLKGEMSLNFQPIVRAQDGTIESYEVVLRWQHPVLGTITPDEFIPLAEETGQILEIGDWVLRKACAIASGWRDDAGTRIAVNVSVKQLNAADYGDTVLRVLAETGCPAARLTLEITESAFSENGSQSLNRTLRRLRKAGIQIHIDDFGTGYSSLSRLGQLSVDAIKIDKSFIHTTDLRNTSILEAAVFIAQRFGVETIAEGIEDAATQERLVKLGIDSLQGYYFGRPSARIPSPGQEYGRGAGNPEGGAAQA